MITAVFTACITMAWAGGASATIDQSGSSGSGSSQAGGSQSGTGSGAGSGSQTGSGSDSDTTGTQGATGSTVTTSGDAAGRQANDQQKFLQKAVVANMAEIQLGQLASQRAQSAEVKQFAQKMVEAHTKALDGLKAAAGSSAQLPTELDSKNQKKHDKLSKLQGQEFDREYVKIMVDAHEDTEDLLADRVKQAHRGSSGSMASNTSDSGSTTGTSGATSTTEGSGSSGDASGSEEGTTGTSGTASTSGTAGASTAPDHSSHSMAAMGGGVDAWAMKTLPDVRTHLQEAKQLHDTLRAQGNQGNREDRPDDQDHSNPGSRSPEQDRGSQGSGSTSTPPQN